MIVAAVGPGAIQSPAATPAVEEYVLELPGVDTTSVGGNLGRVRDRGELPGGIVGEQSGAVTPVAAVGDALSSTAGIVALLAAGLATMAAVARRA